MISAIILAAGKSERMGRPKLLMPLGGSAILEQTVDNFLSSEVSEIIVVVGEKAEEMAELLAARPVKLAVNPDYNQGMSTSIVAGLNHVDSRTRAVMIVLGDQPFIDSRTVNRLMDEFHNHDRGIIIPVYHDRRGHPVIFDMKYREELLNLKGDIGARQIIEKYSWDILEVAVDCEGVCIDIDTVDSPHLRAANSKRYKEGDELRDGRG